MVMMLMRKPEFSLCFSFGYHITPITKCIPPANPPFWPATYLGVYACIDTYETTVLSPSYSQLTTYYFLACLLFLPNRAVFIGPLLPLGGPPPCPFIFLALNPARSPELIASPDLPWRFLPPKPNLASFLARLGLDERPPWKVSERERLPGLLSSVSTATSKRSASLVLRSLPFSERSVWRLA